MQTTPSGTKSVSPAISARNLTKSFVTGRGKRAEMVHAVHNLDLTIQTGERIAFIGPNGAGKSTSIKMFTGILQPTSGELSVLGCDPVRDRKRLVSRLGVLFGQRTQLWEELSLRKGLRYHGLLFRMTRERIATRTSEVLELLDATAIADRPLRTLSLGQRMRCELAAALIHDPEMLFLDEPTIGLDLVAKRNLRELIARINAERGTTIFLTSHDTADIEAVAERVIVINHGEVIFDDSIDAVRKSLLSSRVLDLELNEPLDIAIFGEHPEVEMSPTHVRMRVNANDGEATRVITAALATGAVSDITVTDPPLDEVITAIYARGAHERVS